MFRYSIIFCRFANSFYSLKSIFIKGSMIILRLCVALVILLIISSHSFSQNPLVIPPSSQQITISTRVGAVIDSIDLRYYNLFNYIKGVNSAAAYQIDTVNVMFVLKRFELSDTTLTFPSMTVNNSLSKYIDNFEQLSDEKVYSKLSFPAINKIAQILDYEDRKNNRLPIRLQKRDNKEITGELLVVTDEGIFITSQNEIYNWKTIQNDIQYIPYIEIATIRGANVRYFNGNKQLLLNYFNDEDVLSRTSIFSYSLKKPIPKELRKLIFDATRIQTRTDFLTEDELRLLKPKQSRFTIGIGFGYALPSIINLQLTQTSWINGSTSSSNSDSYYLPLEFRLDYIFGNDSVKRGTISSHISLLTNSDAIFPDKSFWKGASIGILKSFILMSLDDLYKRGSEIEAKIGLDLQFQHLSLDVKNVLPSSTSQRYIDSTINMNIITFNINAGIYYRLQMNEDFSANILAVLSSGLPFTKTDNVTIHQGSNGRNNIYSYELSRKSISLCLGVLFQYRL